MSNRAYGAKKAGLLVTREDVDVISGEELEAEAERIARLLMGETEMSYPELRTKRK